MTKFDAVIVEKGFFKEAICNGNNKEIRVIVIDTSVIQPRYLQLEVNFQRDKVY